MQEVILLKLGELVLKGLNRQKFEERLKNELASRLKVCGPCAVESRQSTIYIVPQDESFDIARAEEICSKVFGVVALCRAAVCEKDVRAIGETATRYLRDELRTARTFKVEGKRSDKKFPLTSIETAIQVAGIVGEVYDHLEADMKHPDVTVHVEVRETAAYVHSAPRPGAGGLPCGINGRATIMISGGIDSPVAAWLMARRGLELHAVHFFSYPYTSDEAKEKVLELARLMCRYTDKMRVNIISLTEIQLAIKENCKEEYFTLILRRFMMRLAAKVCRRRSLPAIITGESLGQVASQTIGALCSTDAIAQENHIPVFRPCIGQDKDEIVVTSRKIGTFDTSILPYEDCCTVFTPKHPKTNPDMEKILEEEAKLDIDLLCKNAFESLEYVNIKYYENT